MRKGSYSSSVSLFTAPKDFYRFDNLPHCYVSQKQKNNLLAQGGGINPIRPFTTSFSSQRRLINFYSVTIRWQPLIILQTPPTIYPLLQKRQIIPAFSPTPEASVLLEHLVQNLNAI